MQRTLGICMMQQRHTMIGYHSFLECGHACEHEQVRGQHGVCWVGSSSCGVLVFRHNHKHDFKFYCTSMQHIECVSLTRIVHCSTTWLTCLTALVKTTLCTLQAEGVIRTSTHTSSSTTKIYRKFLLCKNFSFINIKTQT